MNPEKIGRYEIKAELGRGGMATVYRAYDPRFEREVAIKVLPREMLHDPQFRTRFEREAKTIALLEHPVIVPVYDFGEEDGQPYFVMRFMTGGSLADRLKQGPLSIQEAARIFARLAPALDTAHARGIIHRDLKPANILFDQYNEPYISDFGIAKLTESQVSVTGSGIVGTPAYMSPEQAQGEGIDGRSDIYGLGVILFEMLTGQQPFQGDTPMSVVVKHITDPVPHILDVKPDLPVSVEKIVEKALAKDRTERFSTSRQLSEALQAVERGETPDIGPAPTASRMAMPKTMLAQKPVAEAQKPPVKREQVAGPRPARKRTGLWIGIGLAGLLFLGAAVGGISLILKQFPLVPARATPTWTRAAAANTPVPTKPPVFSPTPQPPADTPVPLATETAQPRTLTIGGADMIAFLNANDIWVMWTDGSNLEQVTTDGAAKTSLQWLPDGQFLLYISGKCIGVAGLDGSARNIACFNSAQYLEDISVSPDGAQIAIALDRVLYVVPLNLEALAGARNHTDLINMNGCLTYSDLASKGADWSSDSKMLAVKIIAPQGGVKVDMVRVMDVSNCGSASPRMVDTFPGPRFSMIGYNDAPYIPSFDWDGGSLFLLNSRVRNNVYGYLYAYNIDTQRAEQLDPLQTGCCYTDAQWSPDGSYVLFAYQDISLGANSRNLLYLVPFGTIGTSATYTPLPLPEGFLANPSEHPEAVFRPVK